MNLSYLVIHLYILHIAEFSEKFFFYFGAAAPSGPRYPHSQGFYITHDTPQLVGILWMSEKLLAETST
jgi:hypothetical protein